MNLTQEIESRIQRFVGELNDLVRKQALQAVSEALGSGASAARRGRPPGSKNIVHGANGAGLRIRSRRKGEKRTAAELAEIERSLFEHVSGNAGMGIEAIGSALGVATGELSRPMKKLIARGAIRTQGAKRATKYWAADGATTTSEVAPARKRGGRRAGAGRKKSKKR